MCMAHHTTPTRLPQVVQWPCFGVRAFPTLRTVICLAPDPLQAIILCSGPPSPLDLPALLQLDLGPIYRKAQTPFARPAASLCTGRRTTSWLLLLDLPKQPVSPTGASLGISSTRAPRPAAAKPQERRCQYRGRLYRITLIRFQPSTARLAACQRAPWSRTNSLTCKMR